MAKAIGIDHLAIYFSDLEKAKKFFLEGLGLTPHGDYDDEFFMRVGDQILALFQGDNKTQTINHLALKVDNFPEIKKRLERLGYKIYKKDMVDGPDGIRIQLIS
ncbi:MAG TPA: VOC family protein [Candidatus Nanoarchaeia archaeon]|nr:VOC family protein [Candidatus Nanoarchaeia archaeon]